MPRVQVIVDGDVRIDKDFCKATISNYVPERAEDGHDHEFRCFAGPPAFDDSAVGGNQP